jgi:hypothetical protein
LAVSISAIEPPYSLPTSAKPAGGGRKQQHEQRFY